MKLKFAIAAAAMATTSLAAPALAKDPVEPVVLPAPAPGMGQIVFFRGGGQGFALGCSVNENGEKVSSLGAGRYFVMETTPGRHEFTAKSEAKDVLALEVEEGEVQYVQCKIKMGFMVGRPDLAPGKEADFRKKSYKMVDADDMGPGPGAIRPVGASEEVADAAM